MHCEYSTRNDPHPHPQNSLDSLIPQLRSSGYKIVISCVITARIRVARTLLGNVLVAKFCDKNTQLVEICQVARQTQGSEQQFY